MTKYGTIRFYNQLTQITLHFVKKNMRCVMRLLDTIKPFFFGLNFNITKCETASIGKVKEIHLAGNGFKFVDFTTDTPKILEVHFSYNKKL